MDVPVGRKVGDTQFWIHALVLSRCEPALTDKIATVWLFESIRSSTPRKLYSVFAFGMKVCAGVYIVCYGMMTVMMMMTMKS